MVDTEKNVMEDSVVKEEKKPVKKTGKTAKPKAEKPEVAEKRNFKSNDLILCKSVCYGELFLIGLKTGMRYSWANSGDVREVEYQDLLSWKVLRSAPLFDPLIVIEDNDLREEWNDALGNLYSKLEDIDLSDLFDMDYDQFVVAVKKLPERVKETVTNMANSMIQDGRLYDLRKIKALDSILGTELMMMID